MLKQRANPHFLRLIRQLHAEWHARLEAGESPESIYITLAAALAEAGTVRVDRG